MMDIQPENNQSPQGSRTFVWWLVGAGCLLALCFCLALTAAGLYGMYLQRMAATPGGNMPVVGLTPPVDDLPHVQSNGASLGDPNAPVKIVLYADFQCPYCRHFWQEAEGLIFKDYVETGKAYFTYRSMGEFLGPESKTAAEAAYCAADQDRFWEYHDLLYANQGAENSGAFSDAHLRGFAEHLQLDMAAFNDCLSTGKYTARVEQDRSDATAMGVNSTPTIVINGVTTIVGARDYQDYRDAIEDALNNGNKGGGG